MSDFRNIMRANNKMYQLEVASESGFMIPPTIATSSPKEAIEFRRQHQNIITKSFAFSPVEIDGEFMALYTTRIGVDDDVDFDGLPLAPSIFQKEIQDKSDIRVTIVGDQVFPCLIKPIGEIENEVDWREGILTEQVAYRPYEELSQSIRQKCIDYVGLLGLSFGVVEFALDPQGNYWFLEINPNEQWGFIEIETGMAISKAIASSLRRA